MTRKLLTLAVAVFLSACATTKPENFASDKPLYDYASKLFAKKNYPEAITFFESLRNRFPQSPYLTDSELKIAEARYAKDDFAEAEVEFQNFRTLHPTNPKIPYVVYMLGMTHVERIPGGIDKDQTHVDKALTIFDELASRWPASPEAEKAQPLITKLKRDLLLRALYIANFYLKQKQYGAAVGRLEDVRAAAEFKDLSAEATYKLGYAHYKLKEPAQAKVVLEELIKNPDAKAYHSKAKDLLRKIEKL